MVDGCLLWWAYAACHPLPVRLYCLYCKRRALAGTPHAHRAVVLLPTVERTPAPAPRRPVLEVEEPAMR